MSTESNQKDFPPLGIGLLRCHKCATTVECRPANLLRYARTKWPECCGEVMTLYQPVPKPVESHSSSEGGGSDVPLG
jgi:hypothetical protein